MGQNVINALEIFSIPAYPHAIGFALLGRSNVGKSTLINALFGRKAARTSKTPGRTRQINVFTFQLERIFKSPFFSLTSPDMVLPKFPKAEQKNWQLLMDTFFNCVLVAIRHSFVCKMRAIPNKRVTKSFTAT